jgi:periplasmic copper chaperone A
MRFKLQYRTRALCSLLATVGVLWPGLVTMATAAGLAGAAATIRVDQAWIRWLPAGLPAGGYTTLTNTGERPVILCAASSPAYAEVSMHRSADRGGTIAMLPITQITIDPHTSVNFEAAGYHFMLMRPIKPLAPGDHVPISLRFVDGSSLTVQFEVRK